MTEGTMKGTDMAETPTSAFKIINSKGRRAPDAEYAKVEAWLREALATVPHGETATTRDLCTLAGYPYDAPEAKHMTNALYWLRKVERVEDCYGFDPTRRWMGNPIVLWHSPAGVVEEQF